MFKDKIYIIDQLKNNGYVILDYFIPPNYIDEFSATLHKKDDFWDLSLDMWTPGYDNVSGIKKEFEEDMMELKNLILGDDENHLDTKNFLGAIMRYPKDGYIHEHTNRGTLSFHYSHDPGFQFFINNEWVDMPTGKLIVFTGNDGADVLGVEPMVHRAINRTGRERNIMIFAPTLSTIDYPWLYGI